MITFQSDKSLIPLAAGAGTLPHYPGYGTYGYGYPGAYYGGHQYASPYALYGGGYYAPV